MKKKEEERCEEEGGIQPPTEKRSIAHDPTSTPVHTTKGMHNLTCSPGSTPTVPVVDVCKPDYRAVNSTPTNHCPNADVLYLKKLQTLFSVKNSQESIYNISRTFWAVLPYAINQLAVSRGCGIERSGCATSRHSFIHSLVRLKK